MDVEDTWRISELARRSGVPVATIKFYVREGLLSRGSSTGAGQAVYSLEHLERLGLISILTGVGGLSLRQTGEVLKAMDAGPVAAHHALGPATSSEPDEYLIRATKDADRFIDEDLGWRVAARAPARLALARALVALRRSTRTVEASALRPYARAADWLIGEELESIDLRASTRERARQAVVGTLAFDAALAALRRMALEHRETSRS